MRKVFVFACMAMFIANTAFVSAWVTPCMQNATISSLNASMAPQKYAVPPCHQMENTHASDRYNQPCDSLCLCDHVSNSPSVLLKNSQGIVLPITLKQSFIIGHDTLASVSQIPPKRPPKIIS